MSRFLLLAAGAVQAVQAVSGTDTMYPPNLNDTSYITDSSLGTYGGVYKAATGGPASASPYGTYDYCSMPHPRAEEYELPRPLQNGSLTGRLVFLEYLQRHQRRTPYNILPGGENQPYDCSNMRPFQFAGPHCGAVQPMEVYTGTYQDDADPFSNGVNGSCQFPQLTLGGFQDGFQHGRDLWAVYGERLGLIPAALDSLADRAKVWFRTSSSPLTQGSAGAVLRGLWPTHAGPLPVPLHLMEGGVDTVNGGYTCAAISATKSLYQTTAAWQAHLAATADLRSQLGRLLGATASDWQTTFDHFADNFQGRLCNGYVLPCSVNASADCVSEEQANMVFRAGDWEWNYYWRTQPYAQKYIQVVEGLFIGEILRHLQAVLDGDAVLAYAHTFVHDGDIGPILGALGIEAMRWPAMASNIAMEVWQTDARDFYARVLYSGQPVRTIHGTLDWIPLKQLISILAPYVPQDIKALCSS